jgi:type IV secretory pathway component VirB8
MKRKGISKTAVRINRDTYAQQKWQRFAGLFMDNNPNLYYINQTQKHLKRIVYSGRINDDCSLSPYSLPDDLEEILSIMKQL